MKLDRYDFAILRALSDDPLISNVALAEAVALSPSPCLRRVRRLREAGVIERALTVISPAAVGLTVQAMVRVRLERHGEADSAAFETAARALPEVLACYLVAGATDYFLLVAAPSLARYGALIKRIGGLPGLRDVESAIVMDTIKPWSPLPLPASPEETEPG